MKDSLEAIIKADKIARERINAIKQNALTDETEFEKYKQEYTKECESRLQKVVDDCEKKGRLVIEKIDKISEEKIQEAENRSVQIKADSEKYANEIFEKIINV